MADRPLRPVAEINEDGVSPASSHRSPVKEFSPTNIFRRHGYHRMASDGSQEMMTYRMRPEGVQQWETACDDSDKEGLGITGFPWKIQRVPVGSKSTSPNTPRSAQGLPSTDSTPYSPGKPFISHSVNHQSSWYSESPTVAEQGDPHQHNTPKFQAMPARSIPEDGHARHTSNGHPEADEFDDEIFHKGFGKPPLYCSSSGDIHVKRTNWLSLTIFFLSIYSTVLSGIWLMVSIVQPRWGHQISSRQGLLPSTATTLAALTSKTIEMSFVTVFISCLGQVLTRRSILRRASGMTLGEMTMRNWVIQPGSLITHAEAVPTAGFTILGTLTLTATVAATFYTTASDAMVAPKLKYGGWESKELTGLVRTSYANPQYVARECPSLLNAQDELHAAASCSNVLYSGASYRNLLNYMSVWTEISENGTGGMTDLKDRPAGTTLLFDNTTMEATWIETEHSSVEANFATWDRVINNVTMAMPHPGVYAAATDEANSILQPDDLAGVGEYMIRAGVVSPSINVMCVNMDRDELAPLVYTEWPNAETDDTGVGDQKGAAAGWESTIPSVPDENEDDDTVIADSFLNSTAVDDVFRWGQKYYRYPPVFPMLPANYNMITNSSVYNSSSIYILAKSPALTDFTLCELNSWTSPNCSTRFDISGTAGARMTTHCEDSDDRNSFIQSFDNGYPEWGAPSKDWKWLADAWRLSMDLNGGVYNNNASNARIITQLALQDPSLPKTLPSIAEALAVYASSTLVSGAIDSPFVHYWEHIPNILDPGVRQAFNASIRTQEYTSGHVNDWQSIFYVILSLVFVINLFCLGYFVTRSGLVTDFTEPQNLFALAVNSPPSEALKGTCGGGPGGESLIIPWRVAYAPSANHYFFEEAERKGKTKAAGSDVESCDRMHTKSGTSYKRLSSRQGWYGF